MKLLRIITLMLFGLSGYACAYGYDDFDTAYYYGSDGDMTIYNRYGDNIYGSDGSSVTRSGNSTYITDSNGNMTICNRSGNSVYCY